MRQRQFAIAAVAVALTLAACGGTPTATTPPAATTPPTPSPPTTISGTLVSGYAHAGPVCPVAQNPPDPECDDRPVADAALLVVGGDGATLAEIRTDAGGQFEVTLPPGAYTLVPQPVEGLLGTASPQEFTVGPASGPDLDVAYDTGIR